RWDHTSSSSYQSDHGCRVLSDLLAKRLPVAFTVFLEKQCLEFLGNHTFHEASVVMVRKYVAGISTTQHGSDGALDAATLQLHMDYLHNPHNLSTACSILATRGIEDNQTAIYKDIMALVELRPRDAAWDECRRKLRDLVESDGGEFFSKQLTWTGHDEYRPLQTDEVEKEKENIRYAIRVLDDFFNSGVHTTAPSDSLPVQHTTGRLDRFLRRCRGQTPEGTPEQVLQV
ncbi:uncharacterized protein EV420DRAFT_365231, partial [Desarmillaria tabescens]